MKKSAKKVVFTLKNDFDEVETLTLDLAGVLHTLAYSFLETIPDDLVKMQLDGFIGYNNYSDKRLVAFLKTELVGMSCNNNDYPTMLNTRLLFGENSERNIPEKYRKKYRDKLRDVVDIQIV